MVQSLNTKVDLEIKASCLMGLTSYGKVVVGDAAFEYYNESKERDFIQIPWEEFDYVSAEVVGKKRITRFAIFTKKDGHFTFSTRDNIKTLRAVREYVPADRLLRSPNFFEVTGRGVKSLGRSIAGAFGGKKDEDK